MEIGVQVLSLTLTALSTRHSQCHGALQGGQLLSWEASVQTISVGQVNPFPAAGNYTIQGTKSFIIHYPCPRKACRSTLAALRWF